MISLFTSVLDVDQQILLALDDKSLFIITQINRNIKNFILKEIELRKRFRYLITWCKCDPLIVYIISIKIMISYLINRWWFNSSF